MTSPCFKCGAARSCEHREVEPAPVVERSPTPRAGNRNSMFGKAGNPTRK